MAKRKGAEANSQEEGDNTATLSPAERAAAARAQIREQKRALKRLRLDEKKVRPVAGPLSVFTPPSLHRLSTFDQPLNPSCSVGPR